MTKPNLIQVFGIDIDLSPFKRRAYYERIFKTLDENITSDWVGVEYLSKICHCSKGALIIPFISLQNRGVVESRKRYVTYRRSCVSEWRRILQQPSKADINLNAQKPSNTQKMTPQTAREIIASPPYAVITSPFTIEAKEGCYVGEEKELTPIVLTLKTELPIIIKAVRPYGGGKPRKSGVCGKPIACSNQKRCPSRKNKECLLNMELWDCDDERLPTSIFAEMTPLILRRLIKSDGYEIVHKKGFLLSAKACGMSKAQVWRVIKKYSPDGKDREHFLSKRRTIKKTEQT
jgi:hypothetical protein